MNEIERAVLERIVPSDDEKQAIRSAIRNLSDRIRDEAEALGATIDIMPVGSSIRDTYLRDNKDIDIFLLFDPSVPHDALETQGLAIGQNVLGTAERFYAEHPYAHGTFDGFSVDIVPCYRVDDPAEKISSVDRTPFHNTYLSRALGPTQKNDVRLLKQFTRGIGVYGAEAAVQGFSGYLCELLIVAYGSFDAVTAHAAGWTAPVVMNVDNTAVDMKRLAETEHKPLIVVDPIDGGRNVASAVSARAFNLFTAACTAYRKQPSQRFFFPHPLRTLNHDELLRKMAERGTAFFGVVLPKPIMTADTLFPQIRKTAASLERLLRIHEFTPEGLDFTVANDILILVELREATVAAIKTHWGPPEHKKSNAERFLEKWADAPNAVDVPHLENGRWCVSVRRTYTDAETLLRERVGGLRFGKDIGVLVDEAGATVITGEHCAKKNPSFLTAYLSDSMPWEIE